MTDAPVTSTSSALRKAWTTLKNENPQLRIRDCATRLGVSEAELLATTVGDYTVRLEGDWTEVMKLLPTLGRVMSLTRNESCVLEHKGAFEEVDIIKAGPHTMATVIGPIETRVFFQGWKFGFAVREETQRGLMQSLQFFDKAGNAITKVYLQPATEQNAGSNQEAFDAIVKQFTAVEQSADVVTEEIKTSPTLPIESVDKEALLTDWAELKDTHDFFMLLRKHKVNRLDAAVLAEGKFTYPVKKESHRQLLEQASQTNLPIMIFAGNTGNIQIHQGEVKTIKVMESPEAVWLNVLDPDFNMHLREDHVASAWVVKKPTVDGVVTGIEVFDSNKEMIVQFFGLRKPGREELTAWRELVEALPKA
ncbi:MAG: hemin-degrading factor [Cyclobacteriaceae bacterium]|nr:hemin-degrading factor [Cyclobacteriaceae bacterium]